MMSFKIGKKPLRLLFSAAAAVITVSMSMTGCGTKYEKIDLTEFETARPAEATAAEEELYAEKDVQEASVRMALTESGAENITENNAASEADTEDEAMGVAAVQAEVPAPEASMKIEQDMQTESSESKEQWNGHVIAVDAGHQAKANAEKEPIGPGAETMKAKMEESAVGAATGVKEYELTLTVAQKLESALEEAGYRVVMIRKGHDVNLSNAERSAIANESDAEILIRLHANSAENSSIYGVLTMCMTEYNPYNAPLHSASYTLSKKIADNISTLTGTKNRGVQQVDNLSAINWSEIPVSIVDMGFLSNPDEDRWLENEEYQDKIVNGITVAVESYFTE